MFFRLLNGIRRFFNHSPPTSFVRIPLKARGALYVSPMPFGPYDTRNQMLKYYRAHKVSKVLILVTDWEIKKKCKKNILKVYEKNGIEYLRAPFKDLVAPVIDQINEVVPQLLVHLKKNKNAAIHCNAGVGRTGVVAACIVAAVNQVSGAAAIKYIKQHMMINMTDEQMRFIKDWARKSLTKYNYFN